MGRAGRGATPSNEPGAWPRRRLLARGPRFGATPGVAFVLILTATLLLPGASPRIATAAGTPVPGPAGSPHPLPRVAVGSARPVPLGPGITSVYGADLLTNIPVKDQPTFASWDSRDDYLFVTNFGNPVLGGNSVTIVAASNDTPIVTYPAGDDPINSVYDPRTGYDYVLNFGLSCNATVFNGTHLVGSVAVGCGPEGATYDPANGWVYISNFISNSIAIVNGTVVVATLSLPGLGTPARPGFSVYDPVHQYVYVPLTGTNNVTVLNGTKFVANVSVGVAPQSAIYDPSTTEVYIVNSGSNNVTILSGTTVVGNAAAGGGPAFGTYDAANGYVYLGDQASDSIFILNGRSEVANLSVGHYPRGAAYDPVRELVFFPNWLTGVVTVLNGTSIVGNVSVGTNPYSALYDPTTRQVYTCVFNSNNVSALGTPNGSYPVTFHESGLPSGVNWTVGVHPSNFTADAPSSIEVPEPNGSYNYSVPAVPGYVASVPSGNFTVAGGAVGLNVSFVRIFGITFNETGLPTGTTWSVTIGSLTNRSTTPTLQLFETNGTYAYAIGPQPGYAATLHGAVQVSGGAAEVNVTFLPFTYRVSFVEQGLPSGTTWSVTFNGGTNQSTGVGVGFRAPNGTYRFTVAPVRGYVPFPSAGPLTVNGSLLVEPVQFVPEFRVTFTESGLPAGANWTVNLSVASNSSTGPTIGFELINGSYTFTVASNAPGYTPFPSPGAVNVTGGPASVRVEFSPPPANATYPVSFDEIGLPSGTSWTVQFGTLSFRSSGASIAFRVVNGSYNYTVAATGFTAHPPNGSLLVDGPSIVPGPVSVSFTSNSSAPMRYDVTFIESGLPGSTRWSVGVAGGVNGSASTSIVVRLADGVYPYSVEPVAGFVATAPTRAGSVTVAGAARTVNVTFGPFNFSVAFAETGLPTGTTWSVTIGTATFDTSAAALALTEPNGTYTYSVDPVPGYSASSGSEFTVNGSSVQVPTVAFASNATGSAGTLWTLPVLVTLAAIVLVAAGVGGYLLTRQRRSRPPPEEPSEAGPSEESEQPDPGMDGAPPESAAGFPE